MRRFRLRTILSVPLVWTCALALATTLLAGGYAGDYVAVDEPSVTLTLEQPADGVIAGVLRAPPYTLPLEVRRQGELYTGLMGEPGDQVPIAIGLDGANLVVSLGTYGAYETLIFRRAEGDGGADSPKSPPPAGGSGSGVAINGVPLSEEELGLIEQNYRIEIPAGDYWYDPVLGAWGVRGSPTLGLIAPGLPIGGKLQADASGGGTLIFVNGRELHPYDVMALQQITGPIAPGRYFIDAQGFAGYEGGPAVWDLGAMIAQSQGGGGGGSNTWQSRVTGASGFSDGSTGAVFLPNGGIVSYGD